MRIALISDNDSINILQLMQERLALEIADLTIDLFIVPLKNDLPFKAAELTEAFDLIFVFTSFEKESFELSVILQKLIDIELKTGTKIIKAFQEILVEEIEDIESEKKRLADKWAELLLTYISSEEK